MEGIVFSETYVRVILAAAPLVVCLAFSLERQWWTPRRRALSLSCALLFSVAVFKGPVSVWGALPWLFLCLYRGGSECLRFSRSPVRGTAESARLAALLYLPVGAVWALFDQLDFQPLGFSRIIVLLTGVHFHYAGFALPRLTGLWLERGRPGGGLRIASWGIILGVPLVAVGITSSQLALPPAIEVIAVSLLACSAFVVSLSQFQWAMMADIPALPRFLLALGGVALAVGMVLATIYGWRSVYPVGWATIPAMYAFHGTLNSLGFCLPGFVAWKLLNHPKSGDSDTSALSSD